jgi:hypothetical protein
MNGGSWWECEKAGCAKLLVYLFDVIGGAALLTSYMIEREREATATGRARPPSDCAKCKDERIKFGLLAFVWMCPFLR